MKTVLQLRDPQVVIDDVDSSIDYGELWAESKGLETDLSALTTPGATKTALYGTLHTIAGPTQLIRQYTFQFIFTGSFVSANFLGSFSLGSPSPCQIDGDSRAGTINLDQFNDQFTCSTNGDVSPQQHNFTFSLEENPGFISFDYLTYVPTEPSNDADVQYFADGTLQAEGDSWELDFNGISAAIYVAMQFGATGPSSTTSLSYVVDKGPPVAFTIANPSQNAQLSIQNQLLVQTPPFPQGKHTLTITLLSGSSGPIFGATVVVQNRKRSTNLEVVPHDPSSSIPTRTAGSTPVAVPAVQTQSSIASLGTDGRTVGGNSSTTGATLSMSASLNISVSSTSTPFTASGINASATTSPTVFTNITTITSAAIPHVTSPDNRNTHHIREAAISAISVPLLLIIIVIWRRISKRQTTAGSDHASMMLPFSTPDPGQSGRLRLAQYTTAEKTEKYRQVFNIQRRPSNPAEVRSPPTDEDNTIGNEEDARAGRPRRVLYRFHEDGGEVAEVDGGEVNEDDDVISLPPIYVTVGSPRPQSYTPHDNPLDGNIPATDPFDTSVSKNVHADVKPQEAISGDDTEQK